MSVSVVALDTETALIQPGLLAPPLACVSLAFDNDDASLLHHSEAEECMAYLFSEGEKRIVGHNIAYDMAVLANKYPHLMPAIFAAYAGDRITDTMLREKLQHIAIGVYRGYEDRDGKTVKLKYSLADIVKRRLGVELDKETHRLNYGSLIDVPLDAWPEGAKQYAIDDAKVTLRLYQDQEKNTELLRDEYRQARAAFWLHLTSCRGLMTDFAAVRQFKSQVETELREVEQELKVTGLVRPDGVRNTKAAKARMFAACHQKGIPTPKTDKGGIRIDSGVCESSGDPLLQDYAKLSSLKKKLSTDVPLLESGLHTPIQARFETLLETGRTSTSPNTQNLGTDLKADPSKLQIRECFVPRPGYLFAAADYEQIELRTVAQVCITLLGHSRLAQALNSGLDPHLEMASRILGVSYVEAERLKKAGDKALKLVRQTSKVANFGFAGGLGAERFVEFAKKSYNVVLTIDQARELKRVWLETWPEFKEYFQMVGRICDKPEPRIEQLFVGRYRGNVKYTEACNSLFQGLAADAIKNAGFLIARDCYTNPNSVLYGSYIVNMIHDELILEVPEEIAPEAAEELARLMVLGAAPFLPDVPAKAEPVLMPRWSKRAETKRGPDGRLVPWTMEAS